LLWVGAEKLVLLKKRDLMSVGENEAPPEAGTIVPLVLLIQAA
jgi:hypothetical protein